MADPNDPELHEQLAEVRTERDNLEEEKDELVEQLAERDDTIDEKDDRIEQLESKVDDLEGEVEPLVEMLAEMVAEDGPLTADSVAERYEAGELVEMLALDFGWDEDDDEAPIEIVREQLAASPSPRGDQGSSRENLGDADLEQAEQLAGEVMAARDLLDKGDESNYEYLKRTYDVDASEFDDVEQLRAAVRGGD